MAFFDSARKLMQIKRGFWHNLSISPHEIVIIYKGDNQLPGGGMGRYLLDQVININLMCGEDFKELM